MKQGKIWGMTERLLCQPGVEIHRITIDPYSHCSNHQHQFKWNGFFVISGLLFIEVEKNYELIDSTILAPGEFTMVPPGEIHRFVTKQMPCLALEIYWPQLLDQNDIVRKDVGGTNDNESVT